MIKEVAKLIDFEERGLYIGLEGMDEGTMAKVSRRIGAELPKENWCRTFFDISAFELPTKELRDPTTQELALLLEHVKKATSIRHTLFGKKCGPVPEGGAGAPRHVLLESSGKISVLQTLAHSGHTTTLGPRKILGDFTRFVQIPRDQTDGWYGIPDLIIYIDTPFRMFEIGEAKHHPLFFSYEPDPTYIKGMLRSYQEALQTLEKSEFAVQIEMVDGTEEVKVIARRVLDIILSATEPQENF
jgi:hypothetical protein